MSESGDAPAPPPLPPPLPEGGPPPRPPEMPRPPQRPAATEQRPAATEQRPAATEQRKGGVPPVPPPLPIPPGPPEPPPLSVPAGAGHATPPAPPPADQIDALASPASDPEPSRYDYNAQQNVDVRPCPSCGGDFEFNIEHQKLVCPHCGASEEIVHDEGASVDEQAYGMLSLKKRERTHLEGEKEVICQSCGGHTTFVGSTTATRCPYCASPLQRNDIHEAPDRLAVDGVLPFVIDDRAAKTELDKWISKRWFAPNEFKKYSTQGSFESVYAAYFTYDAQATTDYAGERGTTRTVTTGSGNNKTTRQVTTWRPARGTVYNEFDDVTVLGNTGFERRYVDKLDPWPTHELQPYSGDYIAGHLCRTYDRDVTDCFKDARQVMEREIDSTIRRDIGGDQQRIHHKNTRLAGVTYKHVLLPIWLLTVLYDGQPLQVFMNGVTGEIHGERPWSKVKIAAAVIAVIIVIIIIAIVRSVSG